MTREGQIEKLRYIVTDMLSNAQGLRVPMSGPIPMQPASVAEHLLDALRDRMPEIFTTEERAYEAGHRAAWTSMLGECLRQLGLGGLEAERLVYERERADQALRSLARDFEIAADWPPNLHLADVVEKHIGRELLEFHAPSSGEEEYDGKAGGDPDVGHKPYCRHCKNPHAMHNARLDFKCMYLETTYEPEDEKP